MQRHILVPLDGSELAETVLPHAIALAQATGSMLTVVLVVAARPAEPLIWPGNSSGAHGTPYGKRLKQRTHTWSRSPRGSKPPESPCAQRSLKAIPPHAFWPVPAGTRARR